jgi:hypothetical protein
MGFLEAIVVVYIRELYYPDGFRFPLKEMPPAIIIIEWTREICTLLMLGSVAWISGKLFLKRLSVFLFIFGVWDIIYYVGLKMFLDWPESLLTWDILFLIPITWVGPVLAPVSCSLLMIFIAVVLDNLISKNKLKKLIPKEWILLISGAAIIYFTFTVDFGMILIKGNFLMDFSNLPENPEFLKILTTWIPSHFNWTVFAFGFAMICTGVIFILRKTIKFK